MFPVRDIANEFWAFVRDLALDPRNGVDDATTEIIELGPARTNSEALDELEERRFQLRVQFAGPHAEISPVGSATGIWRHHGDNRIPWGYLTLQEALVAFLIDSAARNRLSFDREIWLCAVPLIMGDAIRDPDWLHVILRDVDMLGAEGLSLDDPEHQHEHVMTISDDWSCLLRETFDYIVATYTGKG